MFPKQEKRPKIWFLLYEIFRTGKSIETESRSVIGMSEGGLKGIEK